MPINRETPVEQAHEEALKDNEKFDAILGYLNDAANTANKLIRESNVIATSLNDIIASHEADKEWAESEKFSELKRKYNELREQIDSIKKMSEDRIPIFNEEFKKIAGRPIKFIKKGKNGAAESEEA